MKRKPILGESLFSLNIGNAARYAPPSLTPVHVSKVGRKYFECSELGERSHRISKYDLITWREVTDYIANSALYETAEEYDRELETNRLEKQIWAKVAGYGRIDLPLQTLRDIAALISANAEVRDRHPEGGNENHENRAGGGSLD